MTIDEVLKLVPNMNVFGSEVPEEEQEYQAFITTRMKEDISFLLGIDEDSGRGIEFCYEKFEDGKNYYRVRVFTPSTEADWMLAFKLTEELAKKLKVDVLTEYGDKLKPNEVSSIDYKHDMLFGVSCMFGDESENAPKEYTIFGLHRPIVFNKEIQQKLLNAKDPIKAINRFIDGTQYSEAYSAKQMFYKYKDSDEIFGVYVLTEEVDTILPFKPSVEFHNYNVVDPKKINDWKLNMVAYDENDKLEELALVDYREFMEHLPKEKYSYLDARYVIVEYMKKEEMLGVLRSMGKIK